MEAQVLTIKVGLVTKIRGGFGHPFYLLCFSKKAPYRLKRTSDNLTGFVGKLGAYLPELRNVQVTQRTATKRRTYVERAALFEYQLARRVIARRVRRPDFLRQLVICVLHFFAEQALGVIQRMGDQRALCRLE